MPEIGGPARDARGNVRDDLPLRRCADCELNLGDALRAFARCPMWGMDRSQATIRCAAFVPKGSG